MLLLIRCKGRDILQIILHFLSLFFREEQKKFKKNAKRLVESKKSRTFASLLKKSTSRRKFWRDGRVVDRGGLENRCTERYRGFESLSLRKKEADEISSLFEGFHLLLFCKEACGSEGMGLSILLYAKKTR